MGNTMKKSFGESGSKGRRNPLRLRQAEAKAEARTQKKARSKEERVSETPGPEQSQQPTHWVDIGLAAVVLGATFAWAYWPCLTELVATWNREEDYSHGYFVTPLALFFLWVRRDRYPGISRIPGWGGMILVAASMGLEALGRRMHLNPLSGWSLVLWLGGACWLLGGRRVFQWAAPAIFFLVFMVPLPHRTETWLGLPMQKVATTISTFALQSLGQPAVAEGHTIYVGENHLEVARACSGLRMLMGTTALAVAFGVLAQRPLWEKALLVASVGPIAILANSIRITGTGLLYQWTSGETARTFAHDVAGWLMIPLALAMMALLLFYLHRLIVEERGVSKQDLLRREIA